MFVRTFKTAAIATALVIATASASMAATWAYADNDAKVWSKPSKGATEVNWIEEGQKVKIIDKSTSYYKLSIPGKDGWVHKDNLDFDYDFYPAGYPFYGTGGGAQFCADGQKVDFCVGFGF